MLAALRLIGLEISGERDVIFHNAFPACEVPGAALRIAVGEGGTTARFLAALLAAGKREYILKMQGRLSQRPWDELLDALRAAGVKAQWQGNELHLQGPVDLTKLPQQISAARSTQFASALQLAFAQDGFHVTPTELTSSGPYWQMTADCIRSIATGSATVPLDWSSAAYPLVFAAVTGQKIELPGLTPDGQADRALFDWLLSRNSAHSTASGVEAQGLTDRSPLTLSVAHCPDLVPALAFLAAHLDGESELRGVQVLRHKESDRLASVLSLLKQCDVKARYAEASDTLFITGGFPQKRRDLTVPSDHRLVMAGALFLRASGGGSIDQTEETVNKSFPGFFRIFA